MLYEYNNLLMDARYTYQHALFDWNCPNIILNLNWKHSTGLEFMFNGMSGLTNLNINVQSGFPKNTSLSRAFYYCYQLDNIEFQDWDMKNVTNLDYMFANCYMVNNINLCNWNLQNIHNLNGIFYGCNNFRNVDISNWNVSKIKNWDNVFMYCYNITDLNISNWNLQSTQMFNSVFHSCSNLTNLDVSNWNISNIKYMNNTFLWCWVLADLDVSNWDTSNLKSINRTFEGCQSFTNLNVSNWNISNCKVLYNTFASCSGLTNLDVSNWNTCNLRLIDGTFYYCNNLTTLNVSNWQTNNLIDLNYAFYYCENLRDLDVSNWNTSKLQSAVDTFLSCYNLSTLDVSNWNTSRLNNIAYMFYWCNNLSNLDVSNWNTCNLTNLSWTFAGCNHLTELNVSNWQTNNLIDLYGAFRYCDNLTELNLSNWNVQNVADLWYAFSFCNNLQNLYLNNCQFDTIYSTNWLKCKYAFEGLMNNCNIYVSNVLTKKMFLNSRNDLTNIRVCQNLTWEIINNYTIMNTRTKTLNILYGGFEVDDHPNNFSISVSPEETSIYTVNSTLDKTNACISIEFSGIGEGNEVINITLEDDEQNTVSQNVEITSVPYIDGEYVVEPIDKTGLYYAPYDFTLNSNTGYYTSGNTGKSYSYALCKVKFKTNTGKLVVSCINQTTSSTNNFGILSNVDKTLVRNYYSSEQSTNVKKSFSGTASSTAVQKVVYTDLDDEEHFIEIKYRIYNNSTSTTNKFQFKISFTE